MKHFGLRFALSGLGLFLMGHALIHLMIIPGGIEGANGKMGWSGQSWLLDQFLSTPFIQAIGFIIVAGTILFFLTGGLGLLGIPHLKEHWEALTIAGSVLSLLLFAVTWNGLLPHPSDAILGPVVSGVILVGLLLDNIVIRFRHTPRLYTKF